MITKCTTRMGDKKKMLPHVKRDVDYIIIDDLDDKDIVVSPEIVAKRLKWIQSSLIPQSPAPSFVGDRVVVYADMADGADRLVGHLKLNNYGLKIHRLEE